MITCIISTGIIFGFVLNPLSWSFATFQKYHVLGMAASPPRNTLPTSLEISGTHSLSDHPGHFLYCVSIDEIRSRAKMSCSIFLLDGKPTPLQLQVDVCPTKRPGLDGTEERMDARRNAD